MYRVELKVKKFGRTRCGMTTFLMYRVELKDYYRLFVQYLNKPSNGPVPNVPCGVESRTAQ